VAVVAVQARRMTLDGRGCRWGHTVVC
jgi:hypothetical protein